VRALHALNRLPERERVLLTRYWFTPETAKTLAAEIGCSNITLRRRLTRARLRFEKLARQDPALASRFDDSRSWWRRWHFEDSDSDSDSDSETETEDIELDDFEGGQTSTAA
jgi:hypothetical protein